VLTGAEVLGTAVALGAAETALALGAAYLVYRRIEDGRARQLLNQVSKKSSESDRKSRRA
jgi:hypothetical protein